MFKLNQARGREAMLVVIIALIASLVGAWPAQAAVAGYSEYFIPGSTDQLFRILQDIDNNPQLGNAFGVGDCTTGTIPGGGGVGGCNYMHTVVTVSVTTNATTLYYDHWENGYSTGSAGDETFVANEGDVLVFESSNIQVPRAPANLCASTNPNGASTRCYDGRDRVYVAGGSVSVAEAFWPEATATVYANAWEVFPVKPYQTSYSIPVGENLNTDLGYIDFQNVYVIVLAVDDGTIVQIDNPATPGLDLDLILNKGGVTELFGIDAGTQITASQPVQVQFIAGRFNTGISSDSRSYTAVPSGLWDSAYYNPVTGGTSTDTDIFIYNPTGSNLQIDYLDSTGAGSFSIPPGATLSFSDLSGHYVPANSGLYLAAADGATQFWAIGSHDSGSANYNYGFTLIPANILTNEYYLGWAPGSTTLASNGSPVFITPVQNNTTIFVDFSPTDGVVDQTLVVDRIEVLKLLDPDNNNTGMHVWGTGPFAIAWGEDSQYAAVGNPFIDAGYTILPFNQSWIDPVLTLTKSANPEVIPAEVGRAVTFTLVVDSNQPLNPANLIDDLPAGWAYVPLSTTITRPTEVVTGAAAEPVVTGQQLAWNNISPGGLVPGQPVTVEFQAVTTAVPVLGYIINDAEVSGAFNGETFTATSNAAVQISELALEKTSSAGGTTYPGDTILYTLTVSNRGEVPQTNLVVTDPLPVGTTYVAGSTQVILPALNGSVGDAFNAIALNGTQDSNGAPAPSSVGDWVEIGEADGAAAGDVQVLTDISNYQLRLQGPGNGAERDFDLAGCTTAYLSLTYRRATLNAATDSVRLGIGRAGVVTDTLFDFAGPTADTTYQTYTANITNWIDAQTRIQLLSSATLGAAENLFFDDFRIDCYTSTTTPGGAPPNLVTAGDGYDLLAGQSMVINYQVTVNNPPPAGQTEVVNTAQTTSDQQTTPLTATTTDQLAGLLDPPFGLKVFDDQGLPQIEWTVVWINHQNTVPIVAQSSDPIPAGSTYVASGPASGFPVPVGAPTGSTNLGVACLPDPASTSTTTDLCYYEAPTTTFPRGRIVWRGILGPDLGATTTAAAQNEIAIRFRLTVNDGVNTVLNRAIIDVDQNSDADFIDLNEPEVAAASAQWTRSDPPDPVTPRTTPTANSALTPFPFLIPVTGFAPDRLTQLPAQPENRAYVKRPDLALGIPALGVEMPIVGVPFVDGGWDVTWLGESAGYLAGTAFPTWQGNSVITAHVYDANGLPGPFVHLGSLQWGDRILVEAYGQVYTYEVRAVYSVKPYDQRPFGHKDEAWITLITCKQYDPATSSYKQRVIVQAVLVGVDSLK